MAIGFLLDSLNTNTQYYCCDLKVVRFYRLYKEIHARVENYHSGRPIRLFLEHEITVVNVSLLTGRATVLCDHSKEEQDQILNQMQEIRVRYDEELHAVGLVIIKKN